MPQTLRYGKNSILELDLPREAVLGDFRSQAGDPLDDPAGAATAALSEPIDFPPLSQAVVPGDQVALAVGVSVPQLAEVIAGVMKTLLDAGIQPQDVTIVLPPAAGQDQQPDATGRLPAEIRDRVKVETHDPGDRDGLAYLAASKNGNPIYVNRSLGEADVVLPISAARLDDVSRCDSDLFPLFSNDETRCRFSDAISLEEQIRLSEEAQEATWILGVQFALQVVPGPGDSAHQVLAGELHQLLRESQRMCESLWRHEIPRQADLVVATIEGDEDQQTWDNFSRAVSVAAAAVDDGGSIVICSELACQPTPAMVRVAASYPDGASDGVVEDESDDPVSSELTKACERARVFLLSHLEEDVVEDLGMGYVAEPAEIERLARQHESCVLLSSAQHASLALLDE